MVAVALGGCVDAEIETIQVRKLAQSYNRVFVVVHEGKLPKPQVKDLYEAMLQELRSRGMNVDGSVVTPLDLDTNEQEQRLEALSPQGLLVLRPVFAQLYQGGIAEVKYVVEMVDIASESRAWLGEAVNSGGTGVDTFSKRMKLMARKLCNELAANGVVPGGQQE